MKKLWELLWPNMGVFYGLGLIIDNWDRNNALLVGPGILLFLLALRAFVRKEQR